MVQTQSRLNRKWRPQWSPFLFSSAQFGFESSGSQTRNVERLQRDGPQRRPSSGALKGKPNRASLYKSAQFGFESSGSQTRNVERLQRNGLTLPYRRQRKANPIAPLCKRALSLGLNRAIAKREYVERLQRNGLTLPYRRQRKANPIAPLCIRAHHRDFCKI